MLETLPDCQVAEKTAGASGEGLMRRREQRTRLSVVALTIFLDLLGFGIIIPLMPQYAESYGAQPFTYGLLAASYSLMQFLFVPVWGRLSDRIGRRPVLLISIAGSCVSFALLGLAHSLTALFVARILSGFSAANLSVAQAYVADVTTPEERAKGMGMVGAAFGLGFVVGPFVGGELSPIAVHLPLGLSIRQGTAPFFLASLLSLLNWIFAWFRLPESFRPSGDTAASRVRPARTFRGLTRGFLRLDRLWEAVHRPQTGPLFVISFLVTLAFSMMEQTLILFGERRLDMTPVEAGRFMGYIGVLMVLVQGVLVGRLARRFGEERLLLWGTLLMVPGLILIAPVRNYAQLTVVMIPLALGSGLGHPSLNSLLSRRTRADEQGGVLGINQSLSSLARVIGPPLGGFVFQSLGIGSPYLVGGGIMLLAVLLAAQAARPGGILQANGGKPD